MTVLSASPSAPIPGPSTSTTSSRSRPNPPSPSPRSKITIHPYSPDESQLPSIVSLIETELSEPYIIYTYRYFLNQWPHLCFLAYAEDEGDDDGARGSQDQDDAHPTEASSSQLTPGAEGYDRATVSTSAAHLSAAEDDDDEDDDGDASSTLSSPSSISSLSASSTSCRKPRGTPVGVVISKQDRHAKGERLQRGYIAMLSVHPSWRGRGIGKSLATLSISLMVSFGAQEIVLETESDNVSSLSLYDRLGFVREKRLFRFYLNGKDSFRLVLPVPREMWVEVGGEEEEEEGDEMKGRIGTEQRFMDPTQRIQQGIM